MSASLNVVGFGTTINATPALTEAPHFVPQTPRRRAVKTMLLAGCVILGISTLVQAQERPAPIKEQAVPLSQVAVAYDGAGQPALEASLITPAVNGAPDTPVTNIRVVIRNVSSVTYAYASGVITFYDAAGVRCGSGIFKADVLAVNESLETDTPGIRIRCSPARWRTVATNLVPRTLPVETLREGPVGNNLLISVDGEEHPIQLNRPMRVALGGEQHTIVVRKRF